MESFIIDRFEGKWAVIEYGDCMFNFPRQALPEEAKEGDVLDIDVKVNAEATRERQEYVRRRADGLFE